MPNNLRVIYNNVADTATSLTASNTSGSLAASYMQTDIKGEVHRSTGTSVSYTLTWTDAVDIGSAGLPASNLSSTATIRVRLYSDTAGTTLIADSGTLDACPGLDLGIWDWTLPLNANAFAFGGATKCAVWFDEIWSAKRCVIDLVDVDNEAGYIDCSRLVIGSYWSPTYNASYGAQVTLVDTTENRRNDAGDLLPDRGTLYDTMSLDLQMMPEIDRAYLMRIIRSVGTSGKIFISLFPEHDNPVVEQDGMIYGNRANSGIGFDFFQRFSNKLEIEGW
jgi:hypothetical protein